ncbi:MAG: hypothetical protein ABS36_05080 [Acidobacteria bacterium SCN 69-37]|nr:MAG: hypothetical protein ABS36_05080 [Acidobacteria bacterium SCN 69-37]
MITDRLIDQAFSDLRRACGGVREDYFGLLYLENEYNVVRERAVNCVAFGGNDYGIDGFHFDRDQRNLYLFQFKYSKSVGLFKQSLQRLKDIGLQRIFAEPNKDTAKNQLLLQLSACINENRALIDQVCIRFVFLGDPEEAERSPVLERLREDLENRRFLVDEFFGREVRLVIEYRSASGRVGGPPTAAPTARSFSVELDSLLEIAGPGGEQMKVGFIRLVDLVQMRRQIGPRFFDRNIRYGLGEGEAVNRAIGRALRRIVIDAVESPDVFAFNHNGITLYAERFEKRDGKYVLVSPRLLNGAQTVTTTASFLESAKEDRRLDDGRDRLDAIRLMCRVITQADDQFVTSVTINNNRQNPVEPWNLHANDLIQVELQEKFQTDLSIFYERQDNAFDQLSTEDLDEYGIKEDGKPIHLLKLTQTFLLTDGLISRLSEMRRVFEDEKMYSQVFRRGRLQADSRHVLLCYKVQFRLRKLTKEIEQKGQNKYWFVSRARNLLWALVCQGLLNEKNLEEVAEKHGTSISVPADYSELVTRIATTRVRVLLSELLTDKDYADKVAEENLSFLRTDRAFEKSMALAYKRWGWVHKKLQ